MNDENIIPIHTGLQGFYKLIKHKGDAEGNPVPGTEEVVADWFPNLITNNGKNLFANQFAYVAFCQVGTGNTVPSVNDTALANRVAGTSGNDGSGSLGYTFGAQGSAPYFGWGRRVYRFGVGAAAGNLAEVGVGPQNIGNLFSRALIVDGVGAPTVITVLSDEILDVVYEMRVYPILSDLPGNIILEGINRTTVLRSASVTETSGNTTGNFTPGGGGSWNNIGNNGKIAIVYGGAATLGAITSQPLSGPGGGGAQYISAFGQNRITILPYVLNTFYLDCRMDFGLNDANIALGIGAVLFGLQYGCSFQISFSPPLDKQPTKIMSLTFRVYWDRHTPP